MQFTRAAFLFAPWVIAACSSAPHTVASAHDCAAPVPQSYAQAREDAFAHFGRTGQFDTEPSAAAEQARAGRAGEGQRLGLDETRRSYFGRTGQYPNKLSAPVAVPDEARPLDAERAYAFHGKTDQFPSFVTDTGGEVGRADCQRRE